MEYLSKQAYEASIAATRDARMAWWREARFGMFVHYGLYSGSGRQEWAMLKENFTIEEYEKLANEFCPKPGAPREWAKLAKAAGCKYMVLTTRHHEGFSLWDSKVNPYNSVNYGPHRDIVREYVDACREFGLKIGFYSSVMDWHHPDGWKCAVDSEARKRFDDYLLALNTELLSNYGKIDILWYDVPAPLTNWEGWNSLERNQYLRTLQPDIIINNRSKLDEDFGTPEGSIVAQDRDWEACMTWNGISWGYVDSEQATAYGYNANQVLKMLWTVTKDKGNLLLNIGPAPDGSVPEEAIEPLTKVGQWLAENGEAAYGKVDQCTMNWSVCSGTRKKNVVYLWNWIWSKTGSMTVGGFHTKLKSAKFLDGTELPFEQDAYRLTIKNLPEKSPDKICNVGIIKLEFEEEPEFMMGSRYPQIHGGYQVNW